MFYRVCIVWLYVYICIILLLVGSSCVYSVVYNSSVTKFFIFTAVGSKCNEMVATLFFSVILIMGLND